MDLFYEDFRPGDVTSFGAVTITRDAIVDYAREFDPQPFHLDEEMARETFVGTLIASGWHTCALQMRMMCDAWVLRSSSMGGPGVEEVKWLKPVLPGDVLTVRQTVLEAKTSRSRPDMGLVLIRLETLNGALEPVMTETAWVMQGRRNSDGSSGSGRNPARNASAERPKQNLDDLLAGPPAGPVRGYEDLVVGHTEVTGAHVFTDEDIIRFARLYDPQPFHVDVEAARASAYGALIASGWHTGSRWMRSLVDHRAASAAALPPDERPRYGPSPGFTNLRWLKPVRAGDTLRFATTLTDKRVSASRPGWGLSFTRNTAWNQHGECVLVFQSGGFIGLRRT
jgi:acyl dehydratase